MLTSSQRGIETCSRGTCETVGAQEFSECSTRLTSHSAAARFASCFYVAQIKHAVRARGEVVAAYADSEFGMALPSSLKDEDSPP